jgi:hypothetical protein
MTIDGQRSDARATSAQDDEDDAPAAPDYGDLLDAKWLEREAHVLERDDDLVDVGLTLDLDDDDDDDENTYAVDLDVGTLLTSLLPTGADSDGSELALNDGSLASGALSEVLLPEERRSDERTLKQRAEDDEAVGDDEQFPAFDESSRLPESPAADDDGSEGVA